MKRRRSFFLSCSCALFVTLFPLVAADHNTAPQWRKPTISQSADEIQSLAQGALASLVSLGTDGSSGLVQGLDVPQSADLVTALAEFDFHTGGTAYRDRAESIFHGFQSVSPSFTTSALNSETARWGLAAYQLHRAYNNDTYLATAEAIWSQLLVSFVPSSDAAQGSIPGSPDGDRFSSTCGNASIEGAVLWQGSDTLVNGETIGPFIILSSHLYSATQNVTYSTHAASSIEFFKSFLVSGESIFDTFNLSSCTVINNDLFTYNAGFFVEGLSVYSNVTGNFTDTTSRPYLDSVVSSLITGNTWSNRQGVIGAEAESTTSADWKAILMHSLYEYIKRSDLNPSMTSLAKQWIAVQFNAVQDFSTTIGSGEQAYGIGWSNHSAKPSQTIIAPGQLAAAELFNVVLALPETSALSNPSTSSANSGPVSSTAPNANTLTATGQKPLGAIVGGVIGGLAGLMLISAAILLYLKRRQRHSYYRTKPVKLSSDHAIDPYLVPSSSTPEPSSRRVLAADGTRITKLQRERFAPGAAEVYPYPIPPGSIDPRGVEEGTPGRLAHVDPETLQRIVSTFQSIMARMQRREERRVSRQRNSIRKEPLYGQGYDQDL